MKKDHVSMNKEAPVEILCYLLWCNRLLSNVSYTCTPLANHDKLFWGDIKNNCYYN